MNNKDGILDRLCNIYEEIDELEKEKIIRLAEGLLEIQINDVNIETEYLN
jgi:hypothetical protein